MEGLMQAAFTPNQNQFTSDFSPEPQKLPTAKRVIYFVLRNPWISLVGSLLFLACIFILLTPQPQPLDTSLEPPLPPLALPTTPLSKLTTVRFTGSPPTLPDTVAVYTLGATSDPVQQAESLAQKLGLRPQEGSNLRYKWIDPDRLISVQYNVGQQTIAYYKDEPIEEQIAALPVEQSIILTQAMETARTFLTNQVGMNNLQADETAISYISHEVEATPDTAEAVLIPFILQLDNFPLLHNDSAQPLVEVMVNNEYEVVSAVFYPVPAQPTLLTQTSPLNIEQAIGNIRNQSASITSAFSNAQEELSISDITTLELNQVELQYRIIPDSQAIFPYFSFSGTAITEDNLVYDISLITLAIESATTGQ